MAIKLQGYENLPVDAKSYLVGFLERYGVSIRVVEDETLATAGLIMATKQDLLDYNSSEVGPNVRKELVGRCWKTPHYFWDRLQKQMSMGPERRNYHFDYVLNKIKAIQGFGILFADYNHMDVGVLDVCLNDGMTERVQGMGPKAHQFLRAFADWRLADIPPPTPVALQA